MLQSTNKKSYVLEFQDIRFRSIETCPLSQLKNYNYGNTSHTKKLHSVLLSSTTIVHL